MFAENQTPLTLQQSAVEHLTPFCQLETRILGPLYTTVTTDYEALYAYKCINAVYRCLPLIVSRNSVSLVCAYPEFIQLMDDDIVSLIIGLAFVANPPCSESRGQDSIHQLSLFQ